MYVCKGILCSAPASMFDVFFSFSSHLSALKRQQKCQNVFTQQSFAAKLFVASRNKNETYFAL